MGQGYVTLECPGCNTKNRVFTKSPSPSSTSSANFTCSVCKSRLRALLVRERSEQGWLTGNMKAQVAIVHESPELEALREEERKEREAETESKMQADWPEEKNGSHPNQR